MADDHLTKRCRNCDTDKPLSEFGINRAAHDGLTARCRTCANTISAARRLAAPATGAMPQNGFGALARKAIVAERKAAKAKAARRGVAAEYKAAAKVLAPTLALLKAAVVALENLVGPQRAGLVVREKSPQHQAAALAMHARKKAAKAPSPEGPPVIREIATIILEDHVSRVEAKRVQEREIEARAGWRPTFRLN